MAALAPSGCSTREPDHLSEQEFLRRYHDVPLTPEGVTSIIDDRNKRAGKEDNTDYAQAFDGNVSQGMVNLRVLEMLDRGDTAKAKRMLITSMNIDAGFLPVFGARAKLSKEQQEDAAKFARRYLDYLVAHTNEIHVGRPDFGGCFIGLAHVLQDSPDDLNRLTNMIQRLNWPQARKGTAAQPIRSETNSTSAATGSSHSTDIRPERSYPSQDAIATWAAKTWPGGWTKVFAHKQQKIMAVFRTFTSGVATTDISFFAQDGDHWTLVLWYPLRGESLEIEQKEEGLQILGSDYLQGKPVPRMFIPWGALVVV
ncbi:MAG: hypothetical protein WCH99_02475 [Verrucomicrobiota bacterium]